MSEEDVARWGKDSPTPGQLKELFAQIGSGRVTVARMQVFLNGPRLSVWRTIKIGTDENAREIDLCMLTVEEIGEVVSRNFTNGARHKNVCEAIEEVGELCSEEACSPLFLKALRSCTIVPMKPYIYEGKTFYSFFTCGQNVRGCGGDYVWPPSYHFVFVLPQKVGK